MYCGRTKSCVYLVCPYKQTLGTSVHAPLSYPLQVGYLIGDIGEFGKPANLRSDAAALAAQLNSVIGQYGDAQYRSLQQQGMARDAGWDVPAQEWEQVTMKLAAVLMCTLCLYTSFLKFV